MARTFPYSLPYRTCLGRLEDPCSFANIYIEDLRNGQKVYIQNIQQVINILPKTIDPDSRFALRAHITPEGHPRMRDSLRTALLVASSQRRRLQESTQRPPLLSCTPGTACDLTRG